MEVSRNGSLREDYQRDDRSRHHRKRDDDKNNNRSRGEQMSSLLSSSHKDKAGNEYLLSREGKSRMVFRDKDLRINKNQDCSALRRHSSSSSGSSSRSNSRDSERKPDREPGELSSGSEGSAAPDDENARVSPKPSEVKKRKFTPIVWDLDDKAPAANTDTAQDLANGDPPSLALTVAAADSAVEEFKEEEDYEHVRAGNELNDEEEDDYAPRVLSASRWADESNYTGDDAYEDDDMGTNNKRRRAEVENKEEDQSLELGELREEAVENSGPKGSSGEHKHSAGSQSEEGEDGDVDVGRTGEAWGVSLDGNDEMEIDGDGRNGIAQDDESAARSFGSNKEKDGGEDKEMLGGARLSQMPRKINMLHGCRSVDEFERLNRIDEGTYGVVYRARDKKTGEIVALKKVKMDKERDGFPLTSLREINILLSFHHTSIVDVKEVVVGSNLDSIFMVMEYMEHDLKGLMETMKQPFSQSEVKCLMLQLIEGVKYLHDNWVLHRDLKTSNILMNNRGELKICDFGMARQYGSPLRAYTQLVVTLWYRAPELLLGTKLYSTAVDMWSLGCIMAELLAKEPLFPGTTEIDQLDKIFRVLGTPSEKIWPGYSSLTRVKCNFIKQPYNKLREKFPRLSSSFSGRPALSDAGFDLLNKLLTYDPDKRIAVEDALKHEWFTEFPPPKSKEFMPTFPAQHAQDRRLRRVRKSPDPLEELKKKEFQQKEFMGISLFG